MKNNKGLTWFYGMGTLIFMLGTFYAIATHNVRQTNILFVLTWVWVIGFGAIEGIIKYHGDKKESGGKKKGYYSLTLSYINLLVVMGMCFGFGLLSWVCFLANGIQVVPLLYSTFLIIMSFGWLSAVYLSLDKMLVHKKEDSEEEKIIVGCFPD